MDRVRTSDSVRRQYWASVAALNAAKERTAAEADVNGRALTPQLEGPVHGRMRRVVGKSGVDVVDASASSNRAGASALSAALVLVAACAVGVFSDRGALLAEPWSALAEIGTPFVLVAFAAGRQPSRMGSAVVWGAAVLSIGLGAYYTWLFLVHDVAWGTLTHQYRAGAWVAAGVLVGALAGALGSASRAGRAGPIRAVGWGLLIAVPLAEAVRVSRWQPPQVGAGMVLLVVAASLYAWALRQDRAQWQLAGVAVVALIPAVLVAENFRHLM